MKKIISIAVTAAVLFTMPGFLRPMSGTDIRGAEIAASADFTGGQFNGVNLEFEDNSNQDNENYTYPVTKAGVSGRHIDNDKYAYFKVTNNAVTQSDSDLFVEITYYDEGGDGFQLQYNAVSGDYKQATVNTSGSDNWVSTTICLDDAAFKKSQNGGNDFRIWGRGAFGTTVSKLTITKQSVNPSAEPKVQLSRDTSQSEFKGRTFAGYQGWFGTGGQYNSWQHYAYGDADPDGTAWPRPGKISIDYYPDVSEYAESSLSQTGFSNLGDGRPAKLFDSGAKDVIDTHFRWMKEYGIDGAAIQRFVGGLTGRTITGTPEATQLYKIQNAAEVNGRLTYIMYDISGGSQITDAGDTTGISSYVKDMEFDWVYNIEQSLKMLDSPSYATADGRPVVCVWGFGFANEENTRPNRRADYEELVRFFHDRGCYLILGVPREWRTQSQYIDIYEQADMISPWYVGAMGNESDVDNVYRNDLEPDLTECQSKGIDYYPVVFSGFSWALWQGGKPNAMPRDAGQFFWYQAYKLKQLGLDAFYIAMFDEYDEGTAIAKTASDYFDIPVDQYFVTESCDGTWLSSDYQLRVAGEAIKMIKGQREAVRDVPVAHSLGPVYYRNSFESRYVTCHEAQYSGDYPVDPCFKNDIQILAGNANAAVDIEKDAKAKTGDYLTSINGSATADGASFVYRISETAITITKDMTLSYSVYAGNDAGRNTYVDLILSDGSYVSANNISENGVLLGAGSARGTVGAWTDYTFTFGSDDLKGKMITGIALCYSGNAGSFTAYYDDIIIKDKEGGAEPPSEQETETESAAQPETESETENGNPQDQTYYAGNPIITSMFTADPSAHVWEKDGRIYLYASHDVFPSRGCDLMDKYHVFSSDNMVIWKDEGQILSSDDVSWGRPEGGFMWAPDAALKDGKYYFYFPHPTGSGDEWNSTWRVGVAVSDSPAGGFTCASDGYIRKADGSPYVTDIDPCVFKDDDGQFYLYTGGGAKCQVAKLSEDMMTLAEEPVSIESTLTDFHEGMWVFKKDGTYYAMYADNTPDENKLRYSTASSPYGPWKEGGIVLDGTGCDTSHGSIMEYKGKWYLFYHNCSLSGNGTLRSVCIDEVHFNEDGSIQTVTQTTEGVAAAGYVDPDEFEEENTAFDPSEFTEKTEYGIENAELGGGATLGDNVVQNLHLEGAYIEWRNVNGGRGGKAMLNVTYGTPDGGTALVNSTGDPTGDGYFMKFDKTTAWEDYSGTATCFIDLNAGSDNTVRLTCGMGGVNITGMSVSLLDQSAPQPTEKPTEEPSETPTEQVSETQTEKPAETPSETQTEQPTETPSETQTEQQTPAPASSVTMEINGYQISSVTGGFRTLYTIKDPESEANTSEDGIASVGMLYAIKNRLGDASSEMTVGSESASVIQCAATAQGKLDVTAGEDPYSQTFAMTMRFMESPTATYFNSDICVRAYAQLKDGTYVYSAPETFSIYRVADFLYQNGMMNNLDSHNYLYDHILSVVNGGYARKDYEWNNSVVHPGSFSD